jgi:hypothetical protein
MRRTGERRFVLRDLRTKRILVARPFRFLDDFRARRWRSPDSMTYIESRSELKLLIEEGGVRQTDPF